MGKTRRFKDIEGAGESKAGESKGNESRGNQINAYDRGLVAAATAAMGNERRREKENMTDFIEKKREMFLVQMVIFKNMNLIKKKKKFEFVKFSFILCIYIYIY